MALMILASTAGVRRATLLAAESASDVPAPRVTDEAGRAYTIARIPKSQAARIDAHTIRGSWGVPLEIVREDEDAYEVKMYTASSSRPTIVAGTSEPSPGTRAAKDEQPKTRTSRRLRFRAFGSGLPTSGQWREGFGIADMNGDGHPDLVHGPARKTLGAPVVFLGDGRGSWQRWSEARFPAGVYDYGDAQAADLDGDGHPDVVFAMHLHGLRAFLGDGRGTFTDASAGLDFAAESRDATFTSHAIALADWDGDGKPDIIALGEGPRLALGPGSRAATAPNQIVVYLNRGARWERRDADPPSPIFGSAVTVGDFDGDGRLDFATASGMFGRTDLVNLGRPDGGWTATKVPVSSQAYVTAVAARDVDGDGRPDLAIGYLERVGASWRTAIDVLFPRAGGTWERRPLFAEAARTSVPALAIGDVDGDGGADVVALTGDGDTLVFSGDGHGRFAREVGAVPRFPGGCQGAHVALADLDGDGRDEIVASFAEERSSVAEAGRCPSAGGISAWKLQ